jgi:hypothetical protein
VETPYHDDAPWGLDGAILHALGGEEDVHSCLVWRKAGERVAPRSRNKVKPLTVGASSLTGIWWNKKFEPIIGDTAVTCTTTEWEIVQVGEWTDEAAETALSGYGIRTETQSFSQKKPTVDTLKGAILPATAYKRFTPVEAVQYLRLIVPYFENNARVYYKELEELYDMYPDEAELAEWLDAGIPWETLAGYDYLQVSLPLAVQLAQEACYRAEENLTRHYTEFSSTRVRNLPSLSPTGTGPEWASHLLRVGVERDRMIPFLQRTRMNGVFYWRTDVYTYVEGTLGRLNITVPLTWIAEAVAAIPGRDTLIAYSHLVSPENVVTEEWTRHWALESAASTIVRYLQEKGDPAGWTAGWEYPTLHELSYEDRNSTTGGEGTV